MVVQEQLNLANLNGKHEESKHSEVSGRAGELMIFMAWRKHMEGVSFLGAGGIALRLMSLESKMIPRKTYSSYSLLPGSRGPELMAPCFLWAEILEVELS